MLFEYDFKMQTFFKNFCQITAATYLLNSHTQYIIVFYYIKYSRNAIYIVVVWYFASTPYNSSVVRTNDQSFKRTENKVKLIFLFVLLLFGFLIIFL